MRTGQPVSIVQAEQLVWERSFNLLPGNDFDLPAIWTDYGRSFPNIAADPHIPGGTTNGLIVSNGKLLEIHIWTLPAVGYRLDVEIREADTFAGVKTLRRFVSSATPQIEIVHRAIKNVVFVKIWNHSTGLITNGEIKLISRLI